jgi:hypothetical protein
VIEHNILTVYDLATTNSLGSVRAPAPIQRVTFPSPDTLRIYAREWKEDQKPFQIFEYSLSRRTLQLTGELFTPAFWMRFSADGSRVLFRSADGKPSVADGRSGATIVTLPGNISLGNAMFLHDGRIATAQIVGPQPVLRIFAPDGSALREIALPPAKGALVGAEVGRGRVVVRTHTEKVNGGGLVVVDVDSGAVLRSEPGLTLAAYGSLSSPEVLCMTTSKGLVSWNPVTGSKRIISSHS